MKKIILLIVFLSSLARVAYAQVIDSVWSQPYICQAHVFEVKVFGMVADGSIHLGPQNYQLSNDTIYVNFHFVPGIGPAVPMPFQRQLTIPAPPIGQYKIKVQSFYDGTPLVAHFSALSVCAGVAGVREAKTWQPELFPNPATDLIQVSFPTHMPVVSATIIDHTGKTWLHNTNFPKKKITFDLKNLPAGLYFFRIQTHNGIVARPFLKQ